MKSFRQRLQQIQNLENKFLVLLITLISLTLFLALPSISKVGEIIITGLVTLIILAGIYTASSRKRYFYISSITGISAILFNWIDTLNITGFLEQYFRFNDFYFSYIFNVLKLFVYMSFFVFLTARVIAAISKHENVNADVIYGSISGYLLLGITSAFLLTTVEYLMPNSFAMNIEVSTHDDMFRTLFYYSFVTLATIGYGDITPITPLARTLSITLGIAGQMYLTILIAILVSKYLNSQQSD